MHKNLLYLDGYYHTAYELQKGFQIGWDIAGIDQSQVEKVISKPWAVDGKNFSERIWGNKQKLIAEVHKELTQNILLGADPQKAIDTIAKKMNNSKHNAGRLVMTEEAYFSSAAQKDCFQDLDVEQYQILATLDSHTSEICQEMDGKVKQNE
ncbi:MAG: minor capsid protein [Lachnospiraceae bacterium]|nr:minor capsid protein [Lachnospiraceae bacterium]